LRNLFAQTTHHRRNLDPNYEARDSGTVFRQRRLLRLLCARQKSPLVKEANEDANYRAAYFLLPLAPARLEGGGEGPRRKAEVRIGGRTLPRWDVEMASPSPSPAAIGQAAKQRRVKGKFCFNHSRLFLRSSRHSPIQSPRRSVQRTNRPEDSAECAHARSLSVRELLRL